MLSRFYTIPERYGQTDRQNCYINMARQCVAMLPNTIKARDSFLHTTCCYQSVTDRSELRAKGAWPCRVVIWSVGG